jgi:hypothetical protein
VQRKPQNIARQTNNLTEIKMSGSGKASSNYCENIKLHTKNEQFNCERI